MIIVTDTTGLWGNQLWAYSSAIALAKECDDRIIVTVKRDFYESINHHKANSDNHLKIYPTDGFFAKRLKWLIGFLGYRTKKKGFLKAILNKMPLTIFDEFVDENTFKADFRSKHLYLINSWEQRDNKKYFLKHSKEIIKLWEPNQWIIKSVNERIRNLRNANDLIIGVHIRRADDYKTWHGGKYFFDNTVFLKAMHQMQNLLTPQKVLFYIFSDKNINNLNFEGINTLFMPNQNPMSDLWAMGSCDYLMGPLSTFSMWASFCNKVPLYFINKDKDHFNLENFNIIAAQDLYENGNPVIA